MSFEHAKVKLEYVNMCGNTISRFIIHKNEKQNERTERNQVYDQLVHYL